MLTLFDDTTLITVIKHLKKLSECSEKKKGTIPMTSVVVSMPEGGGGGQGAGYCYFTTYVTGLRTFIPLPEYVLFVFSLRVIIRE
jgi:hypothetical protein